MTKYGQTTSYTAKDHIDDLIKYLGEDVLDTILVNTKTPSKETLAWYEDYDEHPVKDDLKTKYRL